MAYFSWNCSKNCNLFSFFLPTRVGYFPPLWCWEGGGVRCTGADLTFHWGGGGLKFEKNIFNCEVKTSLGSATGVHSISPGKGVYRVCCTFIHLSFAILCPTICTCLTVCAAVIIYRVNTPRKQGGLGSMDIPLLADKNSDIAKAYGVYKEDDGIAFRLVSILYIIYTLKSTGAKRYEILFSKIFIPKLHKACLTLYTKSYLVESEWKIIIFL